MKKTLMMMIVGALLVAGTAMGTQVDLTGIGTQSLAYYISHFDTLADAGKIGDKLFYGFAYSASSGLPNSTSVNVVVINDSLEPGFTFQGNWTALPYGGQLDALINFYVQVGDPAGSSGNPITDILLTMDGVNKTTIPPGFVGVDETVRPGGPLGDPPVAIANVFYDGGTHLTDIKLIPPNFGPLYIIKDIKVSGGAPDDDEGSGQSSISSVGNQFSETPIPEPATMLLLGSGLLGLAGFARKKFKK